MILNPRAEKKGFYMKIKHNPHDKLGGRVENDKFKMNVDTMDVQEAQTVEAIVKEAGVFDSPPHEAKVSESSSQEPSISQSKWDKLVVDVAEVKVTQLEIFKKLDMVLNMDRKVNMIWKY